MESGFVSCGPSSPRPQTHLAENIWVFSLDPVWLGLKKKKKERSGWFTERGYSWLVHIHLPPSKQTIKQTQATYRRLRSPSGLRTSAWLGWPWSGPPWSGADLSLGRGAGGSRTCSASPAEGNSKRSRGVAGISVTPSVPQLLRRWDTCWCLRSVDPVSVHVGIRAVCVCLSKQARH